MKEPAIEIGRFGADLQRSCNCDVSFVFVGRFDKELVATKVPSDARTCIGGKGNVLNHSFPLSSCSNQCSLELTSDCLCIRVDHIFIPLVIGVVGRKYAEISKYVWRVKVQVDFVLHAFVSCFVSGCTFESFSKKSSGGTAKVKLFGVVDEFVP